MCRSIKQLRRPEQPATEDELRAAALQYVRKISGFRQPSRANQAAFDAAVDEITEASARLLQALTQRAAAQQSA
ncbi:MAG: DUF2277 domain-containing protein [Chloroflexota bacterium]